MAAGFGVAPPESHAWVLMDLSILTWDAVVARTLAGVVGVAVGRLVWNAKVSSFNECKWGFASRCFN